MAGGRPGSRPNIAWGWGAVQCMFEWGVSMLPCKLNSVKPQKQKRCTRVHKQSTSEGSVQCGFGRWQSPCIALCQLPFCAAAGNRGVLLCAQTQKGLAPPSQCVRCRGCGRSKYTPIATQKAGMQMFSSLANTHASCSFCAAAGSRGVLQQYVAGMWADT